MHRILKLLSINKAPLLIISVALFCIVNFLTPAKKNTDIVKSHENTNTTAKNETAHIAHDHEHFNTSTETKLTNRKPSGGFPKINFSYKNEVAKVHALSKNFPASKPKLLALINKADPFKQKGRVVKPHTSDELTQRKIGAIKVLALKALMEKETQKGTLKRDLINISRNALDPTITQIAKAALKSEEQGRSVFDDFNEAIPVQMPE